MFNKSPIFCEDCIPVKRLYIYEQTFPSRLTFPQNVEFALLLLSCPNLAPAATWHKPEHRLFIDIWLSSVNFVHFW